MPTQKRIPIYEVIGAAYFQLSVTCHPELSLLLDIQWGARGHLPQSKECYSILRLEFKKLGHSITLSFIFPAITIFS